MPSSIAARASIVSITRLELNYQPAPWPFAEQHRSEIDAWFADRQRKNPALWNGRVLLLAGHEIAGPVFRGSFIPVDYASFLAWHDRGCPEAGVRDSFAAGVLRAADGAFLLGQMSAKTANAGRIYFPCGTPDLNDVIGSVVDLDSSVRREVAEETGLAPADYDADPDWITVLQGPYIAHMKVLRLREPASVVRDRITGFLARQRDPELSDIRIVRGPADLEPMMPPFIVAFLKHIWAKSERE
jgi:8-oxo-dGTP pyrophosphatase MutT (NUDIX family)